MDWETAWRSQLSGQTDGRLYQREASELQPVHPQRDTVGARSGPGEQGLPGALWFISVTLLLIESKKETDRERGHLQCFQTAPTSLKLLSRAARKRKPQRLVRALFPVLWLFSRFSGVRLFVTPWTVAHQAPLPMGFSRQECCSGLPWPPPGDRVDSGIRTSVFRLLHWQAGWDLWKDYHQNHPSLPAPVENCAYPGILKVVRPIGCLTSWWYSSSEDLSMPSVVHVKVLVAQSCPALCNPWCLCP